MSRRVRIGLFLPGLGLFAALLVWAVTGIPDFGHYRGPYGDVLNRIAVPERHATNAVGATVFDFRALDTLGEEFILFAAVMGVVLLLRHQAERPEETVDAADGDGLRVLGLLMVGPALVVGLWLAAFGYVTPGGGFQGGVALAGGLLLVYTAWSYRSWHALTAETAFDPAGAIGAGGYVLVGLAALVASLPFLRNLFGPGDTGTLWSAGSIGLLNWASALEVASANVILCAEFLKVYVVPGARKAGE